VRPSAAAATARRTSWRDSDRSSVTTSREGTECRTSVRRVRTPACSQALPAGRKGDPLIIRSKRTIAMPLPWVEVAQSIKHSRQCQSLPPPLQGQTGRRNGIPYAISAKEKGAASLQLLDYLDRHNRRSWTLGNCGSRAKREKPLPARYQRTSVGYAFTRDVWALTPSPFRVLFRDLLTRQASPAPEQRL
jgi:hypothetical protein